jgi:serine protease Do
MSALVGGIVGAVVAALVAGGLVLVTDDDEPSADPGTATTLTRSPDRDGLDIQSILQLAQPSVVSIHTGSAVSPLAEGAGTGFVIDEEGLILTNAHVIAGADEISVTFFDGSALGAELVGSFPGEDVAMIRVEGRDDLRAAVLGSSSDLTVGDDVVAIGNALNLGGQPSVTTGIVSALDRSITAPGISLDNLIQTDAAINPGNSGGPLFNSAGEVVGINTAKIPDASNIGFALSIDSVKPLIEDLRNGDGEVNPDQAFFGVAVTPVDSPDLPPELLEEYGITSMDGVIVTAVTPDSGAATAGLQEGDVILEIANQTIDSDAALGEVIRSKQPGDVVTVVYERRGERAEVDVTLTRRGG